MSSNRNTNNTDNTGNIISWVVVIVLLAIPVTIPIGIIALLIKLGVFGNRSGKRKRSKLDKKKGKRFIRYRNYYAYIEGRATVPISDIAQVSGRSERATLRDIHAMINGGYLDPGAYVDRNLGRLVLSEDEAEKLRLEVRGDSDADTKAALPSDDVAADCIYAANLAELREAGSFIKDKTISDKVSKLEELTAKIFKIAEEEPDKQKQLKRFMSYYLPTTLKLVRSYATLEKQGVKGENIMSTKKSIGEVLDTLSVGFEQQLDQLFKSDAIDIASDISVLENLMQQDGLTGSKQEFQVAQSGT